MTSAAGVQTTLLNLGTNGEVIPSSPQGLLALLQLTDSLAPIGGFAQSHGLEGMVQQGRVRNGREVAQCLDGLIRYSLATSDFVGVIQAQRAAATGALERLIDLDAICSALKVPRESREASMGLGRRLLANALYLVQSPVLDDFRTLVDTERCAGHHCVAYGVVTQALGIAEEAATIGFGYAFAAGVVSAALRLSIVGQREAQVILRQQWAPLAAAAARARTMPPDEMSAFAPILEIAVMSHERTNTRMFAS